MAQNGTGGERPLMLFDCHGDLGRLYFCLSTASMTPDRYQLRQQLRAKRRALFADERHEAALALARRVVDWPVYTEAFRIAGYWACHGELDPTPVFERAWAAGKQVYLPVLVDDPPQSLRFAPYRLGSPLRPNRFKIPEPDMPAIEWLPPNQVDLLLLPLVAFDSAGTRLGMGGGFYDRSFAFLRDPAYQGKRPYLLGLAYTFQKTPDLLLRELWDVPLNAVATETALQVFA